MPYKPLTTLAHNTLLTSVKAGSYVIDATIGNGHDTLFLAQSVGNTGKVFGFDIQESAIRKTKTRLSEHNCFTQVELYFSGHENIAELIPTLYHKKIDAIVFNLGYLPHSDKSTITRSETTIKALTASLELLSNKGLISAMCYPGHIGGQEESNAVIQWAMKLHSEEFTYEIIRSHSPKGPVLVLIRKNQQAKKYPIL